MLKSAENSFGKLIIWGKIKKLNCTECTVTLALIFTKNNISPLINSKFLVNTKVYIQIISRFYIFL